MIFIGKAEIIMKQINEIYGYGDKGTKKSTIESQVKDGNTKNPSIEVRFGARVHSLRVERRLPQDTLANRAQIHRNYLSEMERGKRNVSLRIIERVANALDVELQELFSGKEYHDTSYQ